MKAGYVVLSPDAYWHGDRVGMGPSGMAEQGRPEQESLHKLNLWMGRTLWGMFVRDDQVALDYLCSRPEVDQKRIGATGMSMGSTRGLVAGRGGRSHRVRCRRRLPDALSEPHRPRPAAGRTASTTSSTVCCGTSTPRASSP